MNQQHMIVLLLWGVTACGSSPQSPPLRDVYTYCDDDTACLVEAPMCRSINIESPGNMCTSTCFRREDCFNTFDDPTVRVHVDPLCIPVNDEGRPDSSGRQRLCMPRCTGEECDVGSHCETAMLDTERIDICIPN